MSTAEFAQTGAGAEALPAPRSPRIAIVRRLALGAYAFVFVLWSLQYGISIQRELVIGWIVGALACASIGRSPREIAQLLADWLPMAAFLLAYDYTRGLADSFGISPHFTDDDRLRPLRLPRPDADRVAAGADHRPHGGALVGRLLQLHLHLALHRPLRPGRGAVGPQPDRLQAVQGPLSHPQRRRARHLRPLPRRPALDGLRAGPARADHPQLRPRLRGGQRADGGRLRQGASRSSIWSPPCPRFTPRSRCWSRCSSGRG